MGFAVVKLTTCPCACTPASVRLAACSCTGCCKICSSTISKDSSMVGPSGVFCQPTNGVPRYAMMSLMLCLLGGTGFHEHMRSFEEHLHGDERQDQSHQSFAGDKSAPAEHFFPKRRTE